ncbi:MAG: peptidoglycan-binding protein [bacterium]|nr:peptidoglycan-binding protein [bacterium]
MDGLYGNKTKNAVRAFQKDNGLSVDGAAGPKTISALVGELADKVYSNAPSLIVDDPGKKTDG